MHDSSSKAVIHDMFLLVTLDPKRNHYFYYTIVCCTLFVGRFLEYMTIKSTCKEAIDKRKFELSIRKPNGTVLFHVKLKSTPSIPNCKSFQESWKVKTSQV